MVVAKYTDRDNPSRPQWQYHSIVSNGDRWWIAGVLEVDRSSLFVYIKTMDLDEFFSRSRCDRSVGLVRSCTCSTDHQIDTTNHNNGTPLINTHPEVYCNTNTTNNTTNDPHKKHLSIKTYGNADYETIRIANINSEDVDDGEAGGGRTHVSTDHHTTNYGNGSTIIIHRPDQGCLQHTMNNPMDNTLVTYDPYD